MLECPKCAAEMVTTDRSGIMIDECGGCRGVRGLAHRPS
jgi:Zn-finger nucleic acid-binding protein